MERAQNLRIVWFKRDLRVEDHRALARAAKAGPVLPLYVIEPGLWAQEDSAARHYAFIAESLIELREALARRGQPLVVRIGEIEEVLDSLYEAHRPSALWSHEETGNDWTFQRDRRVAAWCRAKGMPWHEIQQHGVHRRLGTRTGWAKKWDALMGEAQTAAPWLKPIGIEPGAIPEARDLGLAPDPCAGRQIGGRSRGEALLHSFLHERGKPYRKAMSSPLEGAAACSRLSPHLAYGTLSMREVAQANWQRQRDLRGEGGKDARTWGGVLNSFSGRLHWHCHFMQKLEDEPSIEWQNLHPAYEGMRPLEPDAARLAAWAKGETGLPFLDACMRSLQATGWLNFRMRAMVMAVASYHLWLHWRAPGLHLARMFTDYEPGIHWPQTQMQSGTTGINTPRIYNPIKQGTDQDPTGTFTRRWVPELAEVPDKHLQTPWTWDGSGHVLGKTYPDPIVDVAEAARAARQKIFSMRGSADRSETQRVIHKHASRKDSAGHFVNDRAPRKTPRKARKTQADTAQLKFDL